MENLKNGDILRKPVDVKRPVRTYSQAHTLDELSAPLFQMYESYDVPGLLGGTSKLLWEKLTSL